MKDKVNEIRVSYIGGVKSNLWEKVSGSEDCARLFFENWDKNTIELHETFKIMLLNNNNKVKGIYEVSHGGITGTLVDLRIVFAVILKSLSVAIVLAHNHPSGVIKPSRADKDLTAKIKRAASFFDITVLDHLIMVPNGSFYSFADEAIL